MISIERFSFQLESLDFQLESSDFHLESLDFWLESLDNQQKSLEFLLESLFYRKFLEFFLLFQVSQIFANGRGGRVRPLFYCARPCGGLRARPPIAKLSRGPGSSISLPEGLRFEQTKIVQESSLEVKKNEKRLITTEIPPLLKQN